MSVALSSTVVAERAQATQTIHLYPPGVHDFALPSWQTKLIVFTPVICATLLAKLGFPPLSYVGIGLLYPLTFLLIAYGFITGQLQFESRRLTFFLIVLSTLGLMQLLRPDSFSFPSFLMMAALASTFVFTTRSSAVTSADAHRFFCNLSAFIALLGIGQFFIQFLNNPALTFPIETFVPQALRTAGYNTVSPLFYGSPLYKSTGFVMLEPSVFSQVCAIGLMAELAGRSRLLRLVIYAIALIVAYSGTGLLILAVSLPLFVLKYRRWDLLVRGAVLVGIVMLLSEPLNLNLLTGRFDEFGRVGSSGFARFVGWQDLFSDRLWPSTTAALFGHGAGSFEANAVGYAAAQMAHTKIMFEFGVLGGLVYLSFIFFCIYSNGAPRILQVAITACYFMNGAYSPTLTGLALSLLLWPNTKLADSPPPIPEPRHAA
jgi:hypothetical protein